LLILTSIGLKWRKALITIIVIEVASAGIISSFYMIGGFLSTILLFGLVFFVREALVILSSLYRSIRFSGGGNRSLFF